MYACRFARPDRWPKLMTRSSLWRPGITAKGGHGGLWMLQWLSPLPDPNTSVFPINSAMQLAANKGLGGNQPTSIAIGPDGAAYFGNLKNNNLLRLPQPTNTDPNQSVMTVGGIGTARSIYAL